MSLTLDGMFERKIAEIVDGAASLQSPRRIDVGTPQTTINAFAEIVELVEPAPATQRFLGLVEYIAEIHSCRTKRSRAPWDWVTGGGRSRPSRTRV
jgi:hypothetical protein